MEIRGKSFQAAKEKLTFTFFVEISQYNLFVFSMYQFLIKKSKTPMTGAQRFAKYAAKMTEANQEQWSSKMKEKRANYLARMSEQQKDAMRKRDKERKKAI